MYNSCISYCKWFLQFIKLVPVVREMEKYMNQNEIVGYEPPVNELKQLIQQKQYQVLKTITGITVKQGVLDEEEEDLLIDENDESSTLSGIS